MRTDKYVSSDYHYYGKKLQLGRIGAAIAVNSVEFKADSVRVNVRSELSGKDPTYICLMTIESSCWFQFDGRRIVMMDDRLMESEMEKCVPDCVAITVLGSILSWRWYNGVVVLYSHFQMEVL